MVRRYEALRKATGLNGAERPATAAKYPTFAALMSAFRSYSAGFWLRFPSDL